MALASLATGLASAGATTSTRREIPAAALSAFSIASREKLVTLISSPTYRGRIEPEVVADLLHQENKSLDELMLELLPLARLGARPPLSDYHVGAVLQGVSQSLYLGANIEAAGQVLGLAVHGEQAAIANAYMHGEQGLTSLAVTAAPCGHCRQFLTEAMPDGELRIFFPGIAPTRLKVLLPSAFGPQDLGQDHGAFPVRETALQLTQAGADPSVMPALDAARKAYAPYTRSPSGVVVVMTSGRTFAGSYIENVAFNPSLSPLQAALAGAFAAGEDARNIARVVLVESEDARISQKASTQATLTSLAPSARLEILTARRA